MHCLENILLTTSAAVASDEISKAELVRLLKLLADLSHGYSPTTVDESPIIVEMNAQCQRRFGHLMRVEPAIDKWNGWYPKI